MLDHYRISRTTLPKGFPLRLSVWLRSDRIIDEQAWTTGAGQSRQEDPYFNHRSSSSREVPRVSLIPIRDGVAINSGSQTFDYSTRTVANTRELYLFEIPTDHLATGTHELLMSAGGDILLQLAEDIWILEPSDYDRILVDLHTEEFLPSPVLDGYGSVANFVLDLIREQLSGGSFIENTDFSFQLSHGRYRGLSSSDDTNSRTAFPASPIYWATNQLISDFQQLALSGVQSSSWSLHLTDPSFDLRCHGELLEPLSDLATTAMNDYPYGSFLSMLETFNSISPASPTHRSNLRGAFKVDKSIREGATTFYLRVYIGLDDYEVLTST